MKKSIRLGLSVVAATLLFSSVGSAITIFNETFTNPPNAEGLNVVPPQWLLISGSVDVVDGALSTNCTAPSGNNCLDINGSTAVAGKIRSNRMNDLTTAGMLELFTGHAYTFSFYVAGSNRNFGGNGAPNHENTLTWRVYDTVLNTVFASGTETLAFNQTAQLRSVALAGVVNTANVRIEFDGGNDSDNVGLIIDDVNLECSGPNCLGTPEPASLALMGTGLVLLGLRARRR